MLYTFIITTEEILSLEKITPVSQLACPGDTVIFKCVLISVSSNPSPSLIWSERTAGNHEVIYNSETNTSNTNSTGNFSTSAFVSQYLIVSNATLNGALLSYHIKLSITCRSTFTAPITVLIMTAGLYF